MELAEFIKTHIEEINNNNFTEVYKDALDSLSYKGYENTVGKLTEIFLDAGINPLEYMKEVPKRYLDASNITSIEIPNNITSIGSSAFRYCFRLTSIIIPNSVTSIGYRAFDGCSRLTNITIPDSVKKIDNQAFWGCKGLKSITIPEGVTSIGSEAFCCCEGLTSVTIGGSIKNINKNVFDGCKQLKSITIPKSVTKIGYSAFWGCSGLTITFNGTMTEWNAIKKESRWKYASSRFTVHCTDGELKE